MAFEYISVTNGVFSFTIPGEGKTVKLFRGDSVIVQKQLTGSYLRTLQFVREIPAVEKTEEPKKETKKPAAKKAPAKKATTKQKAKVEDKITAVVETEEVVAPKEEVEVKAEDKVTSVVETPEVVETPVEDEKPAPKKRGRRKKS